MHSLEADEEAAGKRLDAWLAAQDLDLSRTRIQQLIKEKCVLVNQQHTKMNYQLKPHDQISIALPEVKEVTVIPEDIPLDILFEDEDIIAINKEAGIVVHPAPGNETGTLVNAILFHCKDLQGIGGELRPGIVHRLDKDTSGVIIIAKNEVSLINLQAQFKNRETKKTYEAIIQGRPFPRFGSINKAIGRSIRDRKKMSLNSPKGRDAISHYNVIAQYDTVAHVEIKIETGRTHQIRVHMASIGHPVVGDRVYGKPSQDKLSPPAGRQYLHAKEISFIHPKSEEELDITAPLPVDMQQTLTRLKE